jgi:hypothetical protein
VVAILDTGVDKNHPFLTGSVLAEACFSMNGNCPNNSVQMIGPGAGIPCTYATRGCKHGTHVAGIVAGQGAAFSGVAKGASLIAIQVFSRFTGVAVCGLPPNDDPCARSFPSDQMRGLDYVLSLHADQILSADAVNMSLGGGRFFDQALCDTNNSLMKERIDDLRKFGIATIIASGNQGWTDSMHAPGCISSAISVGATTKSDAIWSFSNSAPFLSLVAPGESICSSVPTATGTPPPCFSVVDHELWNGTSMAAPHVAGAWAILKQKKPDATVGQILNALQTTGLKIADTRAGANTRVNCRIQIDQALDNISDKLFTLPIPESVTYGINNCGQIVGTEYVASSGFITDTKNSYTSVIYNGPIEPGGFYDSTEATAINNKGEVHGYYCCGFFGNQGFKRTPTGTITEVNTPDTNDIYGTNDVGNLVGTYWVGQPGHVENFIYFAGNTTALTEIAPTDINNRWSYIGVGGSSGLSGTVLDLTGTWPQAFFDPAGSQWTVPFGINESRHIVGCYLVGGTWRSFLRYPDSTIVDISFPGATSSCAYGINDSNQIVGSYEDAGGNIYSYVDLSR